MGSKPALSDSEDEFEIFVATIVIHIPHPPPAQTSRPPPAQPERRKIPKLVNKKLGRKGDGGTDVK